MAFSAGNRLTAAQLNLLAAPPIAILRQTSAQSLTNGAVAAITFDAEDLDTAGGHSTSSNTSRYTCTQAGVYEFSGGVGFASNATGTRTCQWQKNGVDINGGQVKIDPVAGGINTVLPARTVQITLAVNDYVELAAFQNSGGALNTSVTANEQSTMHVRRVSD